MATDRTNRRTIIGRVGLLGASAGIVLGLIEAGCLRLTDLPLPLMKPHVPPSFWFFAPLLTSVAFGLLGLLAGFLAALPRSRFLGMVIIAGFAGLTGAYLALVLRFSQSEAVGISRSSISSRPPSCSQWFSPGLWPLCGPPGSLTLHWAFWPMCRSDFGRGVVFASMATLAVAVGISHLPDHLTALPLTPRAKPQSPNIVLIVWDTARADHFSSYGYFRNTTPNVDQFAKRGVLFENAISASSWTLPSMASVFTSLLPHQHGAGTE